MFYLPTRSVFLFSIIFVYLAVLCLLDPAMLPAFKNYLDFHKLLFAFVCMYLPSVDRRFVDAAASPAIKAKINADAQSS